MTNKLNLPVIFIAISSGVFLLGTYLLATKTNFQPQLLISACGEVLRNIGEHLHFNPDGLVSTLILLTALVGISLTLWQLIKFIISYLHLKRLEKNDVPRKLAQVINNYNLEENTFRVIGGTKLTAYTTGLLRRRIVLSKLLIEKLTNQQLEAVILHELYHLRSHHVLWLLMSRMVSSLLFFIPLIKHLAQQLKIEYELAADAFVLEKQKTRDHLIDALAFRLQYVSEVEPHFATSPIEKRVEYLFENKFSFERVGLKTLAVSGFSLVLMLGIALTGPSQIAANSDLESGGVCITDKECLTTDCAGNETKDDHAFSPLIPASFSLISLH